MLGRPGSYPSLSIYFRLLGPAGLTKHFRYIFRRSNLDPRRCAWVNPGLRMGMILADLLPMTLPEVASRDGRRLIVTTNLLCTSQTIIQNKKLNFGVT